MDAVSFMVCVAVPAASKVLWEASGGGDVRVSANQRSLFHFSFYRLETSLKATKSLEKFPVTTVTFELTLRSAVQLFSRIVQSDFSLL